MSHTNDRRDPPDFPKKPSELIRAQAAGILPNEYLFFWRPGTPESVDKRCMSQWHPVGFEVDGTFYATAEHWMMAEKARLFGDDEMLAEIVASTDPALARRLGRRVRGFDEHLWRTKRVEIVTEGNLAKFEQHPALQEYLIATGKAVLVEASPRDTIWGIGYAADNPKASQPTQWRGLNLLGFALMSARQILRSRRESDGQRP